MNIQVIFGKWISRKLAVAIIAIALISSITVSPAYACAGIAIVAGIYIYAQGRVDAAKEK